MKLIQNIRAINETLKDKFPKEVVEIIKQYYLAVSYKLIIDISDNETIGALIKYIDNETTLSHVLLNGLLYCGGPADDEETYDGDRPEYDPFVLCHLCEQITFARQNPEKCKPKNYHKIKVQYDDKLELAVKNNGDFDRNTYEEYYEDEEPEIANKYINLLEKVNSLNPKEVLLVGYNKLIIRNTRGINDDHRGSDHCQIELPFNDLVIKKKPVTLYKLMQIFYGLKSHKFDKWYEMYCGETESVVKNGVIDLNIKFSHGS